MSDAVQAPESAKKLRGIVARSRPGMQRVGGRKPGTANRINSDIRKMVIHALHYAGGVDYLTAQAHKHPVAFLGLVGRVLPLQVTGEGGGRLQVEFKWADAPITPMIEANAEANAVEAVKDAVIVEEQSEPTSDTEAVEVVFGERNEG